MPLATDYPRDLIGYGANPPHPNWPGEARIALQFVVNYEEGAENSILHGDAASEAFLSEIIGAEAKAGFERDGIVEINQPVDPRQRISRQHALDQPFHRRPIACLLDAEGAIGAAPGRHAGNG